MQTASRGRGRQPGDLRHLRERERGPLARKGADDLETLRESAHYFAADDRRFFCWHVRESISVSERLGTGPILDSTGRRQHDVRMSNFVSIYEK